MAGATADVVVIGAGVNGASVAFRLAERGVRRVVVLERRHLAAGASGKSGSLVRMHYTNVDESRLAFASLRVFQHWDEVVGGDCGFRGRSRVRVRQGSWSLEAFGKEQPPRRMPARLRVSVPGVVLAGLIAVGTTACGGGGKGANTRPAQAVATTTTAADPRAGRHHRDQDPARDRPRRQPPRRHQRRHQRKRQREHRMLELDHLQDDPESGDGGERGSHSVCGRSEPDLTAETQRTQREQEKEFGSCSCSCSCSGSEVRS